MPKPFCDFNSPPQVIHSAVLMYVRYPLRQVESLLFERGINICCETSSEVVNEHIWP